MTSDPLQRFSDGVVRLRPLDVADAEAQVAGEDDAMVRWLSGGRSTVEHQRVYLASAARAWADRHDVFDLGIALVDDDTLVGMVGIQSGMAYLAVGQVNITYGLYPPWRGRGLATRAVRLAIDLALELFRPTELVIRVDRANTASAAVPDRLGFTFSHHTTAEDDGEGELDWYVLKG